MNKLLLQQQVLAQLAQDLAQAEQGARTAHETATHEENIAEICQHGSGRCEGAADFMMVWRQEGAQWRITRVLSYGHRAL
jgi:hypothetical protein